MAKYIINGGSALNGKVFLQGAKNAVLPLFAAALLTEEEVVLHNCPDLLDVDNMARILQSIGADVERHGETIKIRGNLNSYEIPYGLAKELRSSIFLLGSVLARRKKAKVAYPGGCDIGLRPINIHLYAFRELGVKIEEKYGYIYCDASNMQGSHINFDYPSVGATENVMLLAATAKGITTISNAAREPEIEGLQDFLNLMGAKVSGAGTPFITIEGVESLKGTEYTTIPDRIVAGTYLMACAICGGEVELIGARPAHLHALLSKLSKSGCKIKVNNDKIYIKADRRLLPFERVETQPYPGFPTDLQAPLCALASVACGNTVVIENIFETRFKHVPELIKMGARIIVSGSVASIRGVERLRGAEVTAMDLRGGAALVLAGLNAKGTTIINEVHHIERGYENFDAILSSLGADIVKV